MDFYNDIISAIKKLPSRIEKAVTDYLGRNAKLYSAVIPVPLPTDDKHRPQTGVDSQTSKPHAGMVYVGRRPETTDIKIEDFLAEYGLVYPGTEFDGSDTVDYREFR